MTSIHSRPPILKPVTIRFQAKSAALTYADWDASQKTKFEPTPITAKERQLATNIVGNELDKTRQAKLAEEVNREWQTLQDTPHKGHFMQRLGKRLNLNPGMTAMFIADKVGNLTGLEPAELVYWAEAIGRTLANYENVFRPPVSSYLLNQGPVFITHQEVEKASRIIGDPDNFTRQTALRLKMSQAFYQKKVHSSNFLALLREYNRTYNQQFIEDKLTHGTQNPAELVHWARACQVNMQYFKP